MTRYSYAMGTNTLTPGEAMLELQLDKLPAWSLGYLGKNKTIDDG
jgi:hypothetical protein